MLWKVNQESCNSIGMQISDFKSGAARCANYENIQESAPLTPKLSVVGALIHHVLYIIKTLRHNTEVLTKNLF